MNVQYVDKYGVGYNIHRGQDGTWQVWSLHSKTTGWTWIATVRSESLAHSFVSWYGNFEKEGN